MSAALAIIAGVPLGPYRRSRWKPERTGWLIQVIPAKDIRRADLKEVWRRVMNAADNAPLTGAHLLLAHDREDERPTFKELKTRSYRAVWLPRRLSCQYGSCEFQAAVNSTLLFEESWRRLVRPDIDSPLLLPETAFTADPSVSTVWSRARRVDQLRDRIDAVEKALARFRTIHRKRDGWHDKSRLVFNSGPRHGGHELPDWRSRKLTCQLPLGFHFDVRHEQQRRFQIADQEGKRRRFVVYSNVDPHGFVRSGQ